MKWEMLEVEGVGVDGRRIRARVILDEGDDILHVAESIRCWVDDELQRWYRESARAKTLDAKPKLLRVAKRVPLPFQFDEGD